MITPLLHHAQGRDPDELTPAERAAYDQAYGSDSATYSTVVFGETP